MRAPSSTGAIVQRPCWRPPSSAAKHAGESKRGQHSQSIANVYDYTYSLDLMKPDEPVKVLYLRNGEKRETTLTPRARR